MLPVLILATCTHSPYLHWLLLPALTRYLHLLSLPALSLPALTLVTCADSLYLYWPCYLYWPRYLHWLSFYALTLVTYTDLITCTDSHYPHWLLLPALTFITCTDSCYLCWLSLLVLTVCFPSAPVTGLISSATDAGGKWRPGCLCSSSGWIPCHFVRSRGCHRQVCALC